MKKITKTYEVYNFNELSREAKDKVLENNREINVQDDFWSQFLLEEWKEKLDKMGFTDAEIFYSGFCSQGDGASFKASIDIEKFCKYFKQTKYLKKLNVYEISGIITQSGNYCHSNTMCAEIDFNFIEDDSKITEDYDKIKDELEDKILRIAREQADKIYKDLEKEFDAFTSEEMIIETLEANEFVFFKDGRTFNC